MFCPGWGACSAATAEGAGVRGLVGLLGAGAGAGAGCFGAPSSSASSTDDKRETVLNVSPFDTLTRILPFLRPAQMGMEPTVTRLIAPFAVPKRTSSASCFLNSSICKSYSRFSSSARAW